MKKLAIFGLVSSISTVAVVAVACGAMSGSLSNRIADFKPVEANTEMKRIYVVLDDGTWNHTTEGSLWIYGVDSAGNVTAGTSFDDAQKMEIIGGGGETRDNGYAWGLYYADIPSETSTIEIKNYDGAWQEGYDARGTEELSLNVGSEYNAFWLQQSSGGIDAKRVLNPGYVPALTSEQLAHVFSHQFINSCSNNAHNGYYAWKQLENIFITLNLGDIDYSTPVDGDNDAYATTLGDLFAALATRAGYLAPQYKIIYFEDASWWQAYNVTSSLYAWGEGDGNCNVAFPGAAMTHISYDSETNHNIWGTRLDLSNKTTMMFVRCGYVDNVLTDWNARTENISLTNIPEGCNMYSIKDTEAKWYSDNPETNVIVGSWTTYIAA